MDVGGSECLEHILESRAGTHIRMYAVDNVGNKLSSEDRVNVRTLIGT